MLTSLVLLTCWAESPEHHLVYPLDQAESERLDNEIDEMSLGNELSPAARARRRAEVQRRFDDRRRFERSKSVDEVHFVQGCELGYGYDAWKRSCSTGPAIIMPDKCPEGTSTSENCVSVRAGELGWTLYHKKTTSQHDYENLLKTVVKAEGGGFGVSVSASVEWMHKHTVSTRSIGYWIGANGDTQRFTLRNPGLVKLNRAAKLWLKRRPKRFLQLYGTHYVHEVTEATQFIGNAMFKSKAKEWQKKLDVMVTVSVNMLFFSMSVGVGVKTFEKQVDKDTKLEVAARFDGKPVTYSTNVDGITSLKNSFMEWQNNVKTNPVANGKPTRLQYRSLFDLVEVQEYLLEHDDDIIDAFMGDTPSAEVIKIMSEEYFWSKVQRNNLNWMRTSDCFSQDDVDGVMLQNALRSLTAHIIEIDDFSTNDFREKKQLLKKKKYDWFWGREMKFQKMIDAELAKCKVTCKCNGMRNKVTCTDGSTIPCSSGNWCYDGERSHPFEKRNNLCMRCLSSTEMVGQHDKCEGVGPYTEKSKGFPHHSLDSCRAYASHSKVWGGTKEWNKRPGGCIIQRNKIYFNTREGGAAEPDTRRLCCGHKHVPKPAGYEEPMLGFCENHGRDQNSGSHFVTKVHGDDLAERYKCYAACKKANKKRITGCELVWGDKSKSGRGCYVHTKPVTNGSGTSKSEAARQIVCWTMGKYSPSAKVHQEPGCKASEAMAGHRGSEYQGCQTKTRSGRTCRNWATHIDEDIAYSKKRKEKATYAEALLAKLGDADHSYCRNPWGQEKGPWCYVNSSGDRWEYCDPLSEATTLWD